MEEWKEYKLGEVTISVRDRIETSCLDSSSYISTENMLPDKAGVTLSSGIPAGNAIKFEKGDVLISNIRPYFKKIWRANKVGGCSADVICLRASSEVDTLFLYYLLSQDLFFDYVMQGAKGTKMPRGDKNQIMQWPISIPNITLQKKIASILSTLDDKIEVNRRINENLEQQAQALFKSWFVDFEPFKDQPFVESELGMIPQGWRVVSLDNLMTYNGGSQPPASEFIDHYEDGYIRFIQIRDYASDGHITYIPISKRNKLCDVRDIMIARYGASLGRICYGLKGAYNVALAKVTPVKEYYLEYLRCFLNTREFYEGINNKGNRAVQAGFNQSDIQSFRIAFPGKEEILMRFEDTCSRLFDMRLKNEQESRRLAELRDTLLPRLMSGELKVNDLENNEI